MNAITSENEFRHAIKGMDYARQRILGAQFASRVLNLCPDKRIADVLRVAADSNATEEELTSAFHTARSAAVDSHTRCGSQGDWQEQAGYFVARAALATVTPEAQAAGFSPAMQAAMNSRMAQTSRSINAEYDTAVQEAQEQYRILSEYIENQ